MILGATGTTDLFINLGGGEGRLCHSKRDSSRTFRVRRGHADSVRSKKGEQLLLFLKKGPKLQGTGRDREGGKKDFYNRRKYSPAD